MVKLASLAAMDRQAEVATVERVENLAAVAILVARLERLAPILAGLTLEAVHGQTADHGQDPGAPPQAGRHPTPGLVMTLALEKVASMEETLHLESQASPEKEVARLVKEIYAQTNAN